jgi:ABC-type thiamine transport system substrate-binding protein
MVLTLAAPPLRIAPADTLYVYSLPEALALYLEAQRLRRAEQAERLEALALQMEMAALIGGAKQQDARQFVQGLRSRATQLRQPVVPVEYEPLPEAMQRFLNPPPPEG